jgi:FAD/FMN-containing dehydrogenase
MTLEVVEEPVALGAKAAIDPAGIMNPDVLIDRVP